MLSHVIGKITIISMTKKLNYVFLTILAIVFIAGLQQRAHYLGTLSDKYGDGHHQWLTASSMIFVDNWLEDGVWNDRFLLLAKPRSIESVDFQNRHIYPSYPPGSIVPIYWIRKIFPSLTSIQAIRYFGVCNQFLVGIVIFWIIRSIFPEPRLTNACFAFLGAFFYLWMPKPFYFHSMVYFADLAAILPFSIILLQEIWVRKKKSYFSLCGQSLVLACLALIDYLVIPLAMILYVFRLTDPFKKYQSNYQKWLINGLQIFAPIVFVYLIFLINSFIAGALGDLIEKMLYRTAVSDEGNHYIYSFYQQFFINNLSHFLKVIQS